MLQQKTGKVIDKFNVITPGKTKVSTSVRTVSGTSSGGSEVSFIDQGFEPTTLNETTFFPTPRLAASKVNEVEYLSTLPFPQYFEEFEIRNDGNIDILDVTDWVNVGRIDIATYINDNIVDGAFTIQLENGNGLEQPITNFFNPTNIPFIKYDNFLLPHTSTANGSPPNFFKLSSTLIIISFSLPDSSAACTIYNVS